MQSPKCLPHGLTVTYLFCSPLQSDVCHHTQDFINASPSEYCTWLWLCWQTISKSSLPAICWQGVRELISQKSYLFVLAQGDVYEITTSQGTTFVAHLTGCLNPDLQTSTRQALWFQKPKTQEQKVKEWIKPTLCNLQLLACLASRLTKWFLPRPGSMSSANYTNNCRQINVGKAVIVLFS